jgi:hypothetical protein
MPTTITPATTPSSSSHQLPKLQPQTQPLPCFIPSHLTTLTGRQGEKRRGLEDRSVGVTWEEEPETEGEMEEGRIWV